MKNINRASPCEKGPYHIGKLGQAQVSTGCMCTFDLPHDKTNRIVRPAKTQTSLGIPPVWSNSSLCAQWVAKDSRFLHEDSEDSDQTGQMPRLIWVFAGRTVHFVGFVLWRLIWRISSHMVLRSLFSWDGSNIDGESYVPGWYLSLVTRKPVFRVCDQVRLKPTCSATETS